MRLSDHFESFVLWTNHRGLLRLPTWVKYRYPRRSGETLTQWQVRRNIAKAAIQRLGELA